MLSALQLAFYLHITWIICQCISKILKGLWSLSHLKRSNRKHKELTIWQIRLFYLLTRCYVTKLTIKLTWKKVKRLCVHVTVTQFLNPVNKPINAVISVFWHFSVALHVCNIPMSEYPGKQCTLYMYIVGDWTPVLPWGRSHLKIDWVSFFVVVVIIFLHRRPGLTVLKIRSSFFLVVVIFFFIVVTNGNE